MKDKKKRSAYHESSHCIFAWMCGGKIHRLTLHGPISLESDNTQSPHFCMVQHPAMLGINLLKPKEILDRVQINLASYGIEKKVAGKVSIGAVSDVVELMRFISPGYEDETIKHLINRTHQIFDENQDDYEKSASEFFDEFGGPVRELIDRPEVFEAIESLAQILLEKGSLSGFEAVNHIERIWRNDLPENVVPANEHPTNMFGENLESTLASAARLFRISIEVLHKFTPASENEERIVETALRYALGATFMIEDLLNRIFYGEENI